MAHGRFYLLCLLFFLTVPPVSSAHYDYKFENREVKMGQFESEMSAKLTRGVTNILFGWTELVRTPTQWAAQTEHGFVSSVFVGIPYGIVRMMGRTLVGVYEVATFYAPQRPIFKNIEGEIV